MKNLKPRGHKYSMPMHRKVLNAIAERDPAAAGVAMQKLIEDSQRDARDARRAKGLRGAGTPARQAARAPRL